MALNERQKRFVSEYLVDCNATAAYKRAGYRPRNDDVAGAAAARLLADVRVAAAVAEGQAAFAQRNELTQDWVLERLRAEATDHGDGSTQSARVRAVELVGKHLGMFRERIDLQASITIQTVAGVDQARVLGTAERNGQA